MSKLEFYFGIKIKIKNWWFLINIGSLSCNSFELYIVDVF